MLRRDGFPLTLPDKLLDIVCGPAKYPGDFRVAALGGKAAALFLYFCKCFWTFCHNPENLERPDGGFY
jgi:hypothetical protein